MENETAKFTMIDEDFVCDVCGSNISRLGYTARDHCPYCLYSKHVDYNPGDRLCKCHGKLAPIAIEHGKKDSLKIVYRCERCGEIKKNKAANDDNMELIIDISSHPAEY